MIYVYMYMLNDLRSLLCMSFRRDIYTPTRKRAFLVLSMRNRRDTPTPTPTSAGRCILHPTFIDPPRPRFFFKESPAAVVPVSAFAAEAAAGEEVAAEPAEEGPDEELAEDPAESKVESGTPSDSCGESAVYGAGDDPVYREFAH